MSYCDALTGNGIVDASSGLFLAAPRRTGKTTFLLYDMVPEAVSRRWLPVYVDLWESRETSPTRLVAAAVVNALRGEQTRVAAEVAFKAGKSAADVTLDDFGLENAGAPNEKSLAAALRALNEVAGKPVVLIVDEAQEVLATPDDLMFSLKSARDTLGLDANGARRLFIVCTGSHRDKLMHLLLTKKQPFFGSSVQSFPLLGRDYINWYTQRINQHLAADNKFDEQAVFDAFKLVGHRPEELKKIMAEIGFEEGAAHSLGERLARGAIAQQNEIWNDFSRVYNNLNKHQQAMLQLLIEGGAQFEPFAEATLSACSKIVGSNVTANHVQKALDTLRRKDLVWRSARGEYALDDPSFGDWFRRKSETKVPATPAGTPQ
ncbi:MAG TPA: hypothetical protein VL424_19505 [Pararobbsia sp.]|nr:hypothetical protein [Pararobbsia sp.]